MKKSTLLVTAVFAALLVGALVLLAEKPERGITRMSLAEMPRDRIDRLVFGGKNATELKKEDGLWKLANGKLADSAAVTRLLDSFEKLKSSDLLTKDSARFAEYEVDDDQGTKVTAYAGSQVAAEFVIGKNLTGGVGVRVDGKVFRVGGLYQGTFVRTPSAWIEHKLFDDELEDVTRLEVRLAGQPAYALVKAEGTWKVEDPKVLPAGFRFDAGLAQSLVSSVVGLRAKDFVGEDPGVEQTGLDDRADTLTLVIASAAKAEEAAAEEATTETKDAAAEAQAVPVAPVRRVVRLGKSKDNQDVYARVDGREDVFTLHEGTAKGLRKSVLDLRDLRLVSFERDKAKKLTIDSGKARLVLEKKDGAWQLTKSTEPEPADFELDPAAVERRLTSLAAARAVRITEPKERGATGLEGASAKVSVALEGGGTATLVFGREIEEGERELVFAKGNADTAPHLVAKWTRQNLTGGLASFGRQPEPAGMPNLDPQALSNLPPDVRDSLLRQMQQKQREQQLLKQLEGKAPKGEVKPAAPQ